jgi:glycopeptide antibiotics resistance protein
MMVYFTSTHWLIGFGALAITLIILWAQQKSFSYLFFFSVFWVYMMGVVSLVVFPFLMGHPDPYFKPDVNLVPFYSGYCHPAMLWQCVSDIYENILLTIPFGFGISFIARVKPKNIFWLAITVGFTFEFVQLIISLAVRNSFRTVDINDVILNATGALLGYGAFRIFGWLYSAVTHRRQIQHQYVFAYIYDIVRH